MHANIRGLLLLIAAVAVGTGCGNTTPQVHSSAAYADTATQTTLDGSGTAGTVTPVTDATPVTTPTTVAPAPVGWRGPVEVDALVALVYTPPANLGECLTASPFNKENDDAAVLTCLDDEVVRRAYGVTMFERSDSVPLLADIPHDVDEFRDCISTALSSDLVYTRLIEVATTARYWGPDHHGDEVAAEVIDNQFHSCWQRLALG